MKMTINKPKQIPKNNINILEIKTNFHKPKCKNKSKFQKSEYNFKTKTK